MDFRQKLYNRYYTSHYKRFLPQTSQGWEWVIDRIHINFGETLSSIPRNSLILDVGCGAGYFEYYLLKNGFTKVRAIDTSLEQIEVAKEKLLEHGLDYEGKVDFLVENGFEHLKKNSGYNLIVMVDFLEHLAKEDIIELLELSCDALNDGGFLITRTINADNPMFARFFYHDFTHEVPFTPDSIRQCLELVGFEVSKVDYEKVPDFGKGKFNILSRLESLIRYFGLAILGRFLGFSPASLNEDLIAIAKK
jgi:2-polyprenyl-3-methyl-5-hydroxy-6-metoxy-1,4-benzoquinol methylase